MGNAGQNWSGRLALAGVAVAALLNGGCLVAAAAGAAGGGAAAVYAYQRGRLYREYPASLADATSAVRTSLTELGFPTVTEKFKDDERIFTTKTGDDTAIHITLEPLTSRIPAEGPMTRISVRVGTFGDDAVSARILDQVSMHLVAPTPPTTSSPPVVIRPVPPRPPETASPPLAAATK
jgi:hypothetical protein